jgi:hypothetical protein
MSTAVWVALAGIRISERGRRNISASTVERYPRRLDDPLHACFGGWSGLWGRALGASVARTEQDAGSIPAVSTGAAA